MNRNNWSSELFSIFKDLNWENVFINKIVCNIYDASKILEYSFRESWEEKVQIKPKLRTYIQFKTSFEPAKYVTLNLSRSERCFMAQIRLGILPLHIETGRFTHKPINERL